MHGVLSNVRMFAGRKGANAATFRRGNFGPGIMGPGRPPVLMEYGGHLPSRIMDHGIPRPIGGVVAHGRPNRNEVNQRCCFLLRNLLVVSDGLCNLR